MSARKVSSIRSGSRAASARSTQADLTAIISSAPQADQANRVLGNPSLPDVRTQQSFAYGSSETPALPRQLDLDPYMELSEMADNLDDGLRQAQGRNLTGAEEPARSSPERRQSRSMSASVLSSMSPAPEPAARRTAVRNIPSRRTTSRRDASRQQTPEQQLLESLREASEEAETVTKDEPEAEEESVFGSPHTPYFNESSSVSWTTERLIHGNPPQDSNAGTRPNFFRGHPYGSRPTHLQGQTGLSVPPTRVPVFADIPRVIPSIQPTTPPAMRARAIANVGRTLPPVPAFSQGNKYATRSASGSSNSSVSSSSKHTPDSSTHSSPALAAATPAGIISTHSQRGRGIPKNPTGILVTLGLILMAFLAHLCRDRACSLPQMSEYFCSRLPTSDNNSTTMYADAFNKLTYQIDQRLAVMAKDVATLKNEWNKRLPHLKEALSRSPAAMDPLAFPKVNFASVGMGAVVDPYLTSPTMDTLSGLAGRIGHYLAKVPWGLPPVAALQPWDGVGDCWCAATRSNVSQLAILLGRAIVPEDVVIEHIPKGATLDAGAAPREMELWAQYTARPPTSSSPPGSSSSSPPSPSSLSSSREPPSSFPSSSLGSSPPRAAPHIRSPPSPASPSQSPHHLSFSSLRDIILTTLRQVYPNEPVSAYSDDALLGPSFFRVGRWQYNIDGRHHIQRFNLDAVIDMPAVRVQKVVFRVKSNWGAAHTCLYRVRLHGHI
ncbi:hypothetical protein PAAG_05183 [Paracoccidioides lutzii Pb01]|uniref:SUN domain-containing protein n=1 Tax=Paracoccidioides lutzii (strain ATCC MYA-826 / Pb01) TaxID=502779 RepID=C1H340_PARBA|nr:hypothetical protein PAAG_05183 [Paracoccidioides lutzii Pb01]EEH34134.2 hypothetical protein PAAG_05183 [Paracoccidioides lutzii Pb01]